MTDEQATETKPIETPAFIDYFKQSMGWFAIGVGVFTLVYLLLMLDKQPGIFDVELLKTSLSGFFDTPVKFLIEIIGKNCLVTLIILLLSLTGWSFFAKAYSFICGVGIPNAFYTFDFQHPILSLVYIAPHCIIELPTFFAVMALAMQLSSDRGNWKYYFKWYVLAIVPMFVIAGLIEVYITPVAIIKYLDIGYAI